MYYLLLSYVIEAQINRFKLNMNYMEMEITILISSLPLAAEKSLTQLWFRNSPQNVSCFPNLVKPFQYDPNEAMFEMAPMTSLPAGAVIAAAGLGFSLSLLFFMDQNISSALVNTPNNKSVGVQLAVL